MFSRVAGYDVSAPWRNLCARARLDPRFDPRAGHFASPDTCPNDCPDNCLLTELRWQIMGVPSIIEGDIVSPKPLFGDRTPRPFIYHVPLSFFFIYSFAVPLATRQPRIKCRILLVSGLDGQRVAPFLFPMGVEVRLPILFLSPCYQLSVRRSGLASSEFI